MRRAERAVTDQKIIDQFIADEHVLRVAFYDKGEIYIVPVNYGYSNVNDQYTFYFHGAAAGRKYSLSQASPQVGFEIDGKFKLLESSQACNFSAAYQSVIGAGTVHIVHEKSEKIKGISYIMEHETQKKSWNFNDKILDSVAVFRIDVDKISCKAHYDS